MNTEYLVEIRIEETRGGNPLKVGKRFYKTVWIQGTSDDMPVDVVSAANNLISQQLDWTVGK